MGIKCKADLRIGMARVLKIAGIWHQPEWKFAKPERLWRFDLVVGSPALRIAVECDGGVWTQGRHTRGSGYVKDMEKLNEAAVRGWLVLRVTGDMIKDGRALAWIERAIELRTGAVAVGGD